LGLDVRQVLDTLESTVIEACCADDEEDDDEDEVEEQAEEADEDGATRDWPGAIKDDDWVTVVVDVLARLPSDIRRSSSS